MAKLKTARDPKHIERDWENNPRWDGITRDYTAEDVLRLRGSIDIEHTLAQMGADRLWNLLNDEPFVTAALDTVKRWKYEPARFKGQPIAVYRIIQIPFKLTA